MEELFNLDLKGWININLNYKISGNEDWNKVWAITCHTLWDWRNKETHTNNFQHPYEPIINILRRKNEYDKAQILHQAMKGEILGRGVLRWKPPFVNMFKFNTDDNSKNNWMAGCGGLTRDHKDNWKHGFIKFLGEGNALLAEFWGVYEGLKLTKKLGMQRVEINVDSTVVIKAIEVGMTNHLDCVTIFRKIRKLIEEHEVVIISHTYREVNRCTDLLANHGCLMKDTPTFDVAPSFLKLLLEEDAL